MLVAEILGLGGEPAQAETKTEQRVYLKAPRTIWGFLGECLGFGGEGFGSHFEGPRA